MSDNIDKIPDYMSPDERQFYSERFQQWMRHVPPHDFIMECAVREGISYKAVRSAFINGFKQQAFLETQKRFDARERWQAAKGSLRRRAGRPRGTGKYHTDEERKAASRESKRAYKRSERGRLLRRLREVKKLQVAREEIIRQLLREWEESKSAVNAEQITILREYLAKGSQRESRAHNVGIQRLCDRLKLTEAKEVCRVQL